MGNQTAYRTALGLRLGAVWFRGLSFRISNSSSFLPTALPFPNLRDLARSPAQIRSASPSDHLSNRSAAKGDEPSRPPARAWKGTREGGMVALELYRNTTIGVNLTATLDEMVFSGRLAPELAVRVQLQFDESMRDVLEQKLTSRASFKGHLHTYRYCDGVWIFNLTDATFRNEEMTQNIGKVKIVACDASLMKPEVPPQQ